MGRRRGSAGGSPAEDLSRADRESGGRSTHCCADRRCEGRSEFRCQFRREVRGRRNHARESSSPAALRPEKQLARNRLDRRQESPDSTHAAGAGNRCAPVGARSHRTAAVGEAGEGRVSSADCRRKADAGSFHPGKDSMSEDSISELTFLSAVAMAERIRKRDISPVELAEAHLAKIERLNPKLNAYVHTDSTRVRLEALVAESAVSHSKTSGGTLGPLHGVPISIKSSLESAGLRCESGTRLRAGFVATRDAPLGNRLKNAGAIVLGVTNTAELLMAWETDNLLYGRTNNPWDLERTPGGSSGGEAAAIAAGMSAGGVGSDGGGSIRVPAHFSGICGLKPTPGRIPATGHFPVPEGPFASIGAVGPMARTVADLKLLFDVMQGSDVGDTNAAPVPLRWQTEEETRTLRVAYFEDDGRTPVTDETRTALRRAAEALRSAGFRVEPFQPDGLEEARQLWWEYFVVVGGMLLRPKFKGRELDLTPILKQFLEWSAAQPVHTGATLLDAWIRRDAVRAQFFTQMQRYPILLCPAAAIPAFRHRERSWRIEDKTVHYLDAWSYTEFFNLLGNPAAVVPVGQSSEGLPIGVQIVGRSGLEEQPLFIAAVVERECGAWRIPPLA